ncbi:MAG: FtsX-like permease family protein, partial [Verrucomicrobiales bacterium]
AEAQNIQVGDKILLYSPRDIDSVMKSLERVEGAEDAEGRKKAIEETREMTAPQEVTVTGIFDSGHWDFDSSIIFVHLETAQVLYNFDLEECHGIAVRTNDGFKANKFQAKFLALLPQQFRVMTWVEMHKLIFDAVAAERQAMYLILFMIMIVGGFCIMNTMITVTFQKRSEIGLLKALGALEGQVAWVFLFQGILVGLVGVVVGLLLSQVTLYFRNDMAGWIGRSFGVDIFSEEIYKVDGGLPAKQTLRDLVIISTGAFFACTLASLIPALIAASLQPAKALRSE